jgi:hypothetical protein
LGESIFKLLLRDGKEEEWVGAPELVEPEEESEEDAGGDIRGAISCLASLEER